MNQLLKDVHIAVISHARPGNVEKMHKLFNREDLCWYVGYQEGGAYSDAGAGTIVESGGLCESRNSAIELAKKAGRHYCVQLSDDLKKIRLATAPNQAHDITGIEAIKLMKTRLEESFYALAGVAPTANAYFYTGTPTHNAAFCVGDMVLIDVRSDIRWDEKLKLKEDYDFTAAHMTRWGGVVRCNDILAEFLHGSNPGGAVEARTAKLEQKSISYLRQKWGARMFPANRKRENEILFKWQASKGSMLG